MKTIFNLKYSSAWDNDNKPLQLSEGSILHLLFVKWSYGDNDYEFTKEKDNSIVSVYVNQKFVLVYYYKDSDPFSYKNNLVLYNLKKEIINTVKAPKLKSEETKRYNRNSKVSGIGDVIEYEDRKYIEVIIEPDFPEEYDKGEYYYEIQLLDLQTFEYHPTFVKPQFYR